MGRRSHTIFLPSVFHKSKQILNEIFSKQIIFCLPGRIHSCTAPVLTLLLSLLWSILISDTHHSSSTTRRIKIFRDKCQVVRNLRQPGLDANLDRSWCLDDADHNRNSRNGATESNTDNHETSQLSIRRCDKVQLGAKVRRKVEQRIQEIFFHFYYRSIIVGYAVLCLQ